MRLDLTLFISIFHTLLVITQQNHLDLRPLVLVKKGILKPGGEYVVPNSLRKNSDSSKPYHFSGEYTLYFCPPETPEEKTTEQTVGLRGCLFGSRERFTCKTPIQPLATDSGSCSVNGREGQLFKIQYKYCYQPFGKDYFESHFLTVYDFCYDRNAKQTLYTRYTMYSPQLRGHADLDIEEIIYATELSTFDYGIFGDDFITMKSAMDPYADSYNAGPLNQETLISPSHFPFVYLKKPLFHYSNIILIRNNLQLLNKASKVFLSTMATTDDSEIEIFSVLDYNHSTYGENVNEFDRNQQRYIPAILFYLIFNPARTAGIALIIHNLPEDQSPSALPCQKKIRCTKKKEKNISNYAPELMNHVYCCDVNEIMRTLTFWEIPASNRSGRFEVLQKNIEFMYNV